MIRKRQKFKIKINVSFNKAIARRFHRTEYYKAMADDVKILPYKEREKKKFSGVRERSVSDSIDYFKTVDYTKYWKILLGIHKTRLRMVSKQVPHRKAGQLMSILSNVNFLATCYQTVKRKKGAMTLAKEIPPKQLKTRKQDQIQLIKKTVNSPDGMNLNIFKITSQLIKEGRYPWGISRRILIPKPGTKDVMRPITIPPFMDRVVQEGIRRILESIYEPLFEKMNRSFGFRPNKGVHDAIYGLSRQDNWNLSTAIEGDIKSAYDKVNRKILVQFLSQEIEDHKFLGLIKKRLRYTFFDTSKKKYISEKEGIPQGGIDSPYLWNIYMYKFDLFIAAYMQKLLEEKNQKLKTGIYKERLDGSLVTSQHNIRRNRNFTQSYEEGRVLRRALTKKIGKLKINDVSPLEWENICKQIGIDKKTPMEADTIASARYELIKQVRLLRHNRNKEATVATKRSNLKYYYTRYADDWIILGNFDKPLAEKIKMDIKDYLAKELHATLSLEKTLITNIKQKPAKFLGFEFYIRNKYKITKSLRKCTNGSQRIIISRVNNTRIVFRPDQQRMINRFFMENFCNNKGFPISIPWLSTLETYAIIERFNSIIRGLANYYTEWITYPSTLNRWLYILKYSCLKTLAQKYNTTISKVFKRFGIRTQTQHTVSYGVTLKFLRGPLAKEWRLITAKEAKDKALLLQRHKSISETFEMIERGDYLTNYQYPTKEGRMPRVMDKDFLQNINWVSRRTMASLSLPCTLCGETENVEMHHIKHVRKTSYNEIDNNKPWVKLLSLKNRKQIPVCFDCHRHVIHGGNYTGPRLYDIAPSISNSPKGIQIKIFDGRQVNIENFVKPGLFYGSKTLESRGWKPPVKKGDPDNTRYKDLSDDEEY